MAEKENSITRLWAQVKNYVNLNIENAKLTVAEKVTIFATVAAVAVVALLFSVIILFFVSLGLAQLLAQAVGLMWAYLIIASAYLLLFVLFFLLRHTLITNPVARFITRLFFTK